jgi:hypothetical protein
MSKQIQLGADNNSNQRGYISTFCGQCGKLKSHRGCDWMVNGSGNKICVECSKKAKPNLLED